MLSCCKTQQDRRPEAGELFKEKQMELHTKMADTKDAYAINKMLDLDDREPPINTNEKILLRSTRSTLLQLKS